MTAVVSCGLIYVSVLSKLKSINCYVVVPLFPSLIYICESINTMRNFAEYHSLILIRKIERNRNGCIEGKQKAGEEAGAEGRKEKAFS